MQRNIYVIDGYRVAEVGGKEEIMNVAQAMAANVYSRTVPSIAENMGGMRTSAPPYPYTRKAVQRDPWLWVSSPRRQCGGATARARRRPRGVAVRL